MQYIQNIKDTGDGHTVSLFLDLFRALIHNLRINNDGVDAEGLQYNNGAINEFLKLIEVFRLKPERKKEE